MIESQSNALKMINLINLTRSSARISVGFLRFETKLALRNSERQLSLSQILNTFEADHSQKEKRGFPAPKRWPKYNEVIKPPVPIDAPAKPRAEYYHYRDNVKYSPKKMWYICSFVRGLTVDEAVKQLSFIPSKGAHIAKEVILEAQEKALDNGFEFKSNMFIGRCFCTKGLVIKGQLGGPPPKEYYYDPNPKTGQEKLDKFIKDHRDKKIEWTL